MATTERRSGTERLFLLLARRATAALGEPFSQDLEETLSLRLQDAAALPPLERLRWYQREMRALLRVARGGRYDLGAPSAPSGRRAGSLFLTRELRLAARQLWRAPGFTVAAVAILALGIGASTAMFTVVDSVLLQPLQYPEPERILRISNENPNNRFGLSVAGLLGLRDAASGFSAVAAYTSTGSSWYRQTFSMTLTDEPEPWVVEGTWVTADYFDVLGVAPQLGRGFRDGEDLAGAEARVVISHGFWQRRFGGDADAIGQTVEVNRVPHTVIGIMPVDFQPLGNPDAEIWPAFRMLEPGRRGPFFLRVAGRLAPDWSPQQADAALQLVQRDLQRRWNDTFNGSDTRFTTSPLLDDVLGDIGSTLWPLLGAVGLVLAIALANVANLVLSRTARRDQEFAVRVALGAGRRRLLLQLFSEGVILAAAAAVAGVLVARGLLDLLLALAPAQLPRQAEIGLDARAVAVALGLAAVAAICFGLIPVRHAASTRLTSALASSTRSLTSARSGMRLRRALVAGEFALAVPLLVGALVMISTVLSLQRVDPGFDTGRALTMRLVLPVEEYDTVEPVLAVYDQLVGAMSSIPGVEAAALGSSLPPSDLTTRNNFIFRGMPLTADGDEVAHYVSVGPEYFDTLGVPLLRGRPIDADDRIDGQMVAVVDTAFEQRYLGGDSALGREMQFGGCRECPWAQVVGVVGSVRYRGPGTPPEPTIYVPIAQEPQPRFYLALRTSGKPAGTVAAVRQAVARVAPGVALTRLRTMESLFSDAVAAPRYRSLLLGLFAGVALVLAAVGVYAVMTTFVAQQRREVGVRMALGASRGSVVRFVLGSAGLLLGSGVAVGVVLALLSARLLRGLAHGIDPASPMLAVAAALLLAMVALGSTLLPALRASRVDPVKALRSD